MDQEDLKKAAKKAWDADSTWQEEFSDFEQFFGYVQARTRGGVLKPESEIIAGRHNEETN